MGTDDTVTPRAHPEAEAIQVSDIRFQIGDSLILDDVAIDVAAGATLTLLGPSGCGKTTLLRVIAGLERPQAGTVRLGDRTLTSDDTFVDTERRRLGMVFQDGALFPHLTVAENIAFGLPRAERRGSRVRDVIELVGLAGLGERLPATLSGGERQRVALARALAPEPAALLLDEPFASLDASLRTQVRTDVHRLLTELGITSIFVTHDQEEAFVLGDEVAVMRAGRVLVSAPPRVLYERPDDRWVAAFVGDANFVRGEPDGAMVRTTVGPIPVSTRPDANAGSVDVLVRPEHLRLHAASQDDPHWTVELVEYYGHDTMYLLRGDGDERLRARVTAAPLHRRGEHVVARYHGPPTVAYEAVVHEAGKYEAGVHEAGAGADAP